MKPITTQLDTQLGRTQCLVCEPRRDGVPAYHADGPSTRTHLTASAILAAGEVANLWQTSSAAVKAAIAEAFLAAGIPADIVDAFASLAAEERQKGLRVLTNLFTANTDLKAAIHSVTNTPAGWKS